MKNIFLAILFMLTVLVGCRYSDSWETKNIGNEFSVEIPTWMEKTDELKEGAPMQYRNRFRNVYFIAIKDKKDTLPEFALYTQKNITTLKGVLTQPLITDSANATLGGLNGVRAEVMGNMGDEKIFYTHYTLEGKDGFNYQLCIWTRGEERRLRYGAEMNRMIQSFKML